MVQSLAPLHRSVQKALHMLALRCPTRRTVAVMSSPSYFETPQAFAAWLEANAAAAPELLVGFHKVWSGRASMSWSESVDEALCFGWIDGVRKRIDDTSYSIRFAPRKPTSIWSAINIAKFEQLLVQGRMTAAGAIAFAHRTEARSVVYAYEQASAAELSTGEVRALSRNKSARAFFEGSPPGYKKQILHWVTSAKKAETRASRFAKLLEACAAGQRLR